MFDFEKLEVYQVTKTQNIDVLKYLISDNQIEENLKSRWRTSSQDAVSFLVESTARMSHQDKKNYLINARSSINNSVAILELCQEMGWMNQDDFDKFYSKYEQMSKMMLGMIRSFN